MNHQCNPGELKADAAHCQCGQYWVRNNGLWRAVTRTVGEPLVAQAVKAREVRKAEKRSGVNSKGFHFTNIATSGSKAIYILGAGDKARMLTVDQIWYGSAHSDSGDKFKTYLAVDAHDDTYCKWVLTKWGNGHVAAVDAVKAAVSTNPLWWNQIHDPKGSISANYNKFAETINTRKNHGYITTHLTPRGRDV